MARGGDRNLYVNICTQTVILSLPGDVCECVDSFLAEMPAKTTMTMTMAPNSAMHSPQHTAATKG